MPETKKVKELMVSLAGYPVIHDDGTVRDAIKVLKNYLAEGKEHRSILVFSKNKKVQGEEELVGILTVRDIFNAIKRNKSCYDNTELFAMSWAYFYRKDPLNECIITKVGQITRPLVKAFLQSDEDVTKAIELMMTKNINLVPVFEGKKAVGIVRAIDILDYIAEML